MKLLITLSSQISFILLSTLFSNSLSLCPSHNVRDQVSLPYKIPGKIGVFHILILKLLDQAWATFPSLGAKSSFCLRVKGRTKLLNKIN
jgi:hypothetical protein